MAHLARCSLLSTSAVLWQGNRFLLAFVSHCHYTTFREKMKHIYLAIEK